MQQIEERVLMEIEACQDWIGPLPAGAGKAAKHTGQRVGRSTNRLSQAEIAGALYTGLVRR